MSASTTRPRCRGGASPCCWELRDAGASDAVTALATRAADHARLDGPQSVAALLWKLRQAGAGAGAGDAVTALAVRAAGHVSLDDPRGVVVLLRELRDAGASDAVTALLARDRGGLGRLGNPSDVAFLLREAGASEAVTALATLAAGHVSLDDPSDVAELLRELRDAGASDAVIALLARDPAGHTRLDDPSDVAELLRGAARGRGQRRGPCPVGPRSRRAHPPWRPVGRHRAAAGSCARPGPATRPVSWPPVPPTRACSIFSLRSALTRPPATCSAASRTAPHRNPGNGKSQPASPNRARRCRHA
jgi:hypothetical protein